ncbi:NAD-binding protein [Treponema pectinovorum]|uniref:NAD-binding protein n=1 Tax=Treponema pectinovorum TaxID=164 RepID=UPI003D94EAB1
MKIVIVGAGFTGIQLAKRLVNGKNDVVLIDNDEETVRHASNSLDCDVIQAEGNNLQTLENAGIKEADALVCVTSNDEVNMITCSLVDAVYPNVVKIARVRNYAYYVDTASVEKNERVRPLYGIDYMVHPDVEAAEAIANAAKHGTITDVMPLGDEYELIRVCVEKGSKLENQQLVNVRKITDIPVLIAYVETDGETRLPSGETVIHAEDCLGALILKDDIPEFLKLCGAKVKKIKKVAIVGAGRVGTIVLEKLIQRKSNLVTWLFKKEGSPTQEFCIIDSDEERAKAAEEKFNGVKVFCADATEEGFIEEEGIDKYDLAICATHNHELNIVMSAYFESIGIPNSIALVGNNAFGEIARKIGIEVAVPIRDTVVDSIMSHLKGRSVTGVHTVNEGSLEIVEITVGKDCSVKGCSLRDIAENGKFLILMMQKSGKNEQFIPIGNTTIEEKDQIVLITTNEENQHVLEKFGAEL